MRLGAPRAGVALLLVAAASVAAGCTTPVRYHYTRSADEVDGAIDRLELTVRCAEDEGGAVAAHRTARLAIKQTREALDQDPLDIPAMAGALDEAAKTLDKVAEESQAALPGAKPTPLPEGRSEVRWDPMGQRDRIYDLGNQAKRAAREVRALRRAVAGAPGEG